MFFRVKIRVSDSDRITIRVWVSDIMTINVLLL